MDTTKISRFIIDGNLLLYKRDQSSMNILMVSNEFPPSVGGVQTHVFELSRALTKIGHRVQVITRDRNQGTPRRESIDGIFVERLPLPNSHLLYDRMLRYHLQKAIRKNDIDIVHVHGMRPLNACRKLAIPVIFTNHTSSFVRRASKGGKAQKKMLHQLQPASAVLTASDILSEKTKETGYTGPVSFISNGVDPAIFYPGPSSLRRELSIDPDAYVIAIACRLEPVKGVRYLAAAVASIDNPELQLVIAGDGSEKSDIESILKKQIQSGNAHLLGSIDYSKMPEIYRGADASSLPSLMEATSIAGLEAMACGLPIIGSRVGGIPFIVEDGKTGILTEPESVGEIKQAIQLLLNDRVLSRRMGDAGLEAVIQHFTWSKVAQQVVTHYRKLIDQYTPQKKLA